MSLVEEVGLAMANSDGRKLDLPDIACIEDFRFDVDRQGYLATARAVIPIILDAAAKVADGWRASDFDESANTMADNIATDIRALGEGGE